jgi:hypothetical protein
MAAQGDFDQVIGASHLVHRHGQADVDSSEIVKRLGHCARLAGSIITEGDWLSIDGEAGAIYHGRCTVIVERPEAELAEIERWRTKLPAPHDPTEAGGSNSTHTGYSAAIA